MAEAATNTASDVLSKGKQAERSGPAVTSVALAYGFALALALAVMTLWGAGDYVGFDNDDVMRLVEIRDFLSGQGWFDLMQYRLGLAPGTLMHWSRLIDLPIAGLIAFASIWLPAERAEAVALALWPLLLVLPSLWAMGKAGHLVAGRLGLHLSLLYTSALILFSRRFTPGAIDHHNAQMALAAILLAVVLEPVARPWRSALAGFAAALAIAIGAETVPFVATICTVVALRFAIEGVSQAAPARIFGLSIFAFLSLFFVGTVPVQAYASVTCDNFSLGFYAIAGFGGLGLALATLRSGSARWPERCLRLAVLGVALGLVAHWLAPDCLRSPLADLDPMLVDLWLSHILEARSLPQMIREMPYISAAYYMPGLVALAICLIRIALRQRLAQHLILLLPLAVSFAVSCVQVRGALFSHLVAILPFVMLIADLRRPAAGGLGPRWLSLCYIAAILAAAPQSWGVGGLALQHWVEGDRGDEPDARAACGSRAALADLARLPATTVAAPSNIGAAILRFTHHRVLAAPYHRNQQGMLAELKLGLAPPAEAEKILTATGTGILAFCPSDVQTSLLMSRSPAGLYAQLSRSVVPDYLTSLPSPPGSELKLFSVIARP